MKEEMSPINGTVIRARYRLTPAELKRITEIGDIRRSANERLDVLHQKVQDCTRLMEGFMTEVKWREGWQEGDIVVIEPRTKDVLCLKVIGQ